MERENWTLGRLLRVSGGYWEAFTLQAGVKLDIFTLIGDHTWSNEEIAERLGGDERGVGLLLNAMSAMGLIVKSGKKYANTPTSKQYLVKGAPNYIGFMIMHHHHLISAWSQLSRAVIDGRPVRKRDIDEKERESFLMGMFVNALPLAPQIAKGIDLGNRHHLLDLGGGPGTYAIHFCLANPGLKATVYDLSDTRPYAVSTIQRFHLGDRIGFMPGDYLKEGIEGKYDVAWLSHILHSLGPEECRIVLQKAVSVMEPGGVILIHDFILNDTLDSPLFPALFALNMLVNTKGGRSYSEGQIVKMLSERGVKEISRLPWKGPTESGIIRGIV